MLNHGNNKYNNIPKILLFKNLTDFFFSIHQEIKWINNLKISFEDFITRKCVDKPLQPTT